VHTENVHPKRKTTNTAGSIIGRSRAVYAPDQRGKRAGKCGTEVAPVFGWLFKEYLEFNKLRRHVNWLAGEVRPAGYRIPSEKVLDHVESPDLRVSAGNLAITLKPVAGCWSGNTAIECYKKLFAKTFFPS